MRGFHDVGTFIRGTDTFGVLKLARIALASQNENFMLLTRTLVPPSKHLVECHKFVKLGAKAYQEHRHCDHSPNVNDVV